MAIQKTEAIVIRTQAFRSSSLIVTFFSKSFGKLKGIAKGVRQEREMRGALFELFTRLDIVFYEKLKSDLHLVSEAFMIESYPALRRNLESISYACYFSELADEMSELHDPHEKVFDLLDSSFRYLSSIPGKRIARIFEIKLMNEIGWLPHLTGCLNCSKAPLESGFFSPRQGALVCQSCAKSVPDVLPVNGEALALMRRYVQDDFEVALRSGMSQKCENEIQILMERFLNERLRRPVKSRLFLQRLNRHFKAAVVRKA